MSTALLPCVQSGLTAGMPARTRGGCAGQSAPLHGPKTAKRLSSGRKPVAVRRVWRSSASRVKRIRGLCGGEPAPRVSSPLPPANGPHLKRILSPYVAFGDPPQAEPNVSAGCAAGFAAVSHASPPCLRHRLRDGVLAPCASFSLPLQTAPLETVLSPSFRHGCLRARPKRRAYPFPAGSVSTFPPRAAKSSKNPG